MKRILSASETQQVDAYTINTIGIPGAVLMERAALAVTEAVCAYVGVKEETGRFNEILVAVGTGNNGGDGIAAARQLRQRGYAAALYLVGDPEKGSEEFCRQLAIARRLAIPEVSCLEDRYAVVVDGIFGTGLSRKIEGIYAHAVEQLNRLHSYRIAIDIPSGVNATTGQIMGTAFRADRTVTFGFHKIGQLLYPGAEYCGQVECADIGFPAQAAERLEDSLVLYEREDLSRLPARMPRSNKGTYGKALLITGKKNMAGAACLSAEAAYRTGCGLAELVTAEENRCIVQQVVPEAILRTYRNTDEAKEAAEACVETASSVVIGPGIGTSGTARQLLASVLSRARVPVVIDADGLNVLAETAQFREWMDVRACPVIVTPHLKEMSRLCEKPVSEIQNHLLEVAKAYAREYNVIVVLKDAHTVVAEPGGRAYLNVSGNSGMATGGTGDVLAGIIGGFLAQGMDGYEAAKLGVYVHGLAGDAAAEAKGSRGMIAGDLLQYLPQLIRGE